MTQEYWNCPFCNYELEMNATYCPQCGSDKETGWADSQEHHVEEEHDYEAALEYEFSKDKKINDDWSKFLKTAAVIGILILVIKLLV